MHEIHESLMREKLWVLFKELYVSIKIQGQLIRQARNINSCKSTTHIFYTVPQKPSSPGSINSHRFRIAQVRSTLAANKSCDILRRLEGSLARRGGGWKTNPFEIVQPFNLLAEWRRDTEDAVSSSLFSRVSANTSAVRRL